MMRSFGARSDFAVLDEPFFAPYLAVSGVDHPGRVETLAAHDRDPKSVAALCASDPPGDEPYYFQKHMPHHMLPGFPMNWARNARHFFLIREPARVIASYIKGREQFELDDLGYAPQCRLFDDLTTMTGREPPVIDCVDILRQPEAMLRALCIAIDIPFDPAMLSWEPGSRPEDGAWAPYWYKSVESSTKFGAPPTHKPSIPDAYQDILADCEKDYKALYKIRLNVLENNSDNR